MSLRAKTYAAVRWTTAAAASRLLLQLLQLAVLARLLTPADYGLMAIAVVVMSFTSLLSDLGVNSAYVQSQSVTSAQRSSLFWLNVGVSGFLTLLMLALSPLLAWLFGDERLAPVLALVSFLFVINAFGQQLRVTSEKLLEFRPVFGMELTAGVIGFVAAVLSALNGLGVYSLVLGMLVTSIVGTCYAWIFLAKGWRPHWRFSLADVRPYLGFGGAMMGNSVVNQINMNIDLLLGGSLLTAAQLGVYSVPRQLVLRLQFMINPIITRVGFPLIAKVQHDIGQVRTIYLRTLGMTSAVNAPLYLLLAIFAPDVVAVLLGDRWVESATFLRVLAIWGFIRSTGNPVGSLLYGMGRATLALKWNAAYMLIGPPVLILGSHYGPEGIAYALLGLSIVMFVPGWWFLVRPLCHVGLLEYMFVAVRPFVLAAVCYVPAVLIADLFDSPVARLASGMVVAAPAYLALSFVFNRSWTDSARELLVGARR